MAEEKKVKKHLKGWQLLYVATLFYLVNWLIGGAVGNLSGVFGFIFLLIAIVTGIVNMAKKKYDNLPFDIVMTIVSTIIFIVVVGLKGTS